MEYSQVSKDQQRQILKGRIAVNINGIIRYLWFYDNV